MKNLYNECTQQETAASIFQICAKEWLGPEEPKSNRLSRKMEAVHQVLLRAR